MNYTAAVIGTGRIGFTLQNDKKREQPASHTSALKGNKKVKLIAGCDCNEDSLNDWKKNNPNAEIFSDVKSFLKKEIPDIVSIAVNESDHFKVTEKVIKASPSIIILEKPVALTLEEASKIKELSIKYKVPIIVNHERRYSKDYTTAKEIIKSGKLGKIESIYASLWSSLTVFSKEETKTGHYSLIHDGTHLVDTVNFLMDTALSSPEISAVRKDDKGNVKFLSVGFDNDSAYVNIEISGNKEFFGFDIDIRGTKGRLIIGNGYLKYYIKKESPYYSGFYSLVKNKKIKRPSKTGYFSYMVSNAVEYLDGKEELLSGIDDGFNALKVLKEIESKL